MSITEIQMKIRESGAKAPRKWNLPCPKPPAGLAWAWDVRLYCHQHHISPNTTAPPAPVADKPSITEPGSTIDTPARPDDEIDSKGYNHKQ